jgi:16S rRNA (guanine527-N7)-methyltransferase
MIRSSQNPGAELAADRARALALTPVSRETSQRLDDLAALLMRWQRTTNLVAPSTLKRLWTRHIADSLQLLEVARARDGPAQVWVDFGSGAGFPGLVIACALGGTPDAQVHLVESNAKKAAFLREAVRATAAPALVHCARMEEFVNHFQGRADVVTARAVAPLRALLAACADLLKTGALGIFPKGRDVEVELTEAAKYWNIQAETVSSRTDPSGRIVVVRDVTQRKTP